MDLKIKDQSYTLGDLVQAGKLRKDPQDMDTMLWFMRRWLMKADGSEVAEAELLVLPLAYAKQLMGQVVAKVTAECVKATAEMTAGEVTSKH